MEMIITSLFGESEVEMGLRILSLEEYKMIP
jgi:hypothetical protein